MDQRQSHLSILIVSYNTRAMTLACLDSLPVDAGYEIIVVDNASTDGSADAIAAHPLAPILIASRENLGFARANNLAASHARGEVLLLLNPDTVVKPGAIGRLAAFAEARPEAGIWGGRTVFADGSLNATSSFGDMTVWSLFCRALGLSALASSSQWLNGETYGRWQRDCEREVDVVTGCFLLIRRELWQRLGGFDPTYFMYGEEVDLCIRARKLGARPRVTPDAEIVHYGGASEKTRAGRAVKVLTAKSTLIRRHWPLPLVRLGLLLLLAWPAGRWLVTEAAAWLSGRRAIIEARDAWREIVARRAEWLPGYTSGLDARTPAMGDNMFEAAS